MALRPQVAARLARAGLDTIFHPFDPASYNPALPVAGNLLFAVPRAAITQDSLLAQRDFMTLLRELNLQTELLALSRDVVEMLRQTFGLDGTGHPLFRKLGLSPDVYGRAVALLQETTQTPRALTDAELALLLTVPFQISAEQIGPVFSDEMKDRIVRLRQSDASVLKTRSGTLFTPLDPAEFSPGLTVLENTIFGKISETAGTRTDGLREIVSKALQEADLRRPVTDLIFGLRTELGGSNLSSILAETMDLARAAIKRPDILILDQALASFDAPARNTALARLRQALPEATLIHLQNRFADPEAFDAYFEVSHAQILRPGAAAPEGDDNAASADLTRKLRLIETADLFSGLERKQQRLLAFGARWFTAPADTVIFRRNDDPSDGAYLIAAGEAGLYRPVEGEADRLIATARPGALVGELGLIRNEPRALGMRAHTEVTALRLSTEAFLSVVENDAATAFKVLQVVAGYVPHSSD